MDYRIGTVGFGYRQWAGPFYPRNLRPAEYLSFYARYFDTVELDTTFHAVPEPELVRRWANAVPEGFRFSVKAPSAVTHEPPISDRPGQMRAFLDVMRELGPKLGPVLIQFAPHFTFSQVDGLKGFLAGLPADVRYAVEFRDESWLTSQTADLLGEYNCCWAVGDYDLPPLGVRITTDFLYVRWIGQHQRFGHLDREQIDPTERLQWWKARFDAAVDRAGQVWAYANNDFAGYAIATANRAKTMVGIDAQLPDSAERGELFDY